MRDALVIVGGGLAGAKAAEGAREAGWEGPVRIIGAEPRIPYERPPLSKAVLQGADEPESTYIYDGDWHDQQGVEIHTGEVVEALDVANHAVRLRGGASFDYAKLVLATGSTPVRPDLPGATARGTFTLRTIDDSIALRDRFTRGSRLIVVGGGWIGAEVAASAVARGVEVTMIVRGEALLERVLGRRVGDFFVRLHRGHGVDVRLGAEIVSVEDSGEALVATLSDGSRVETDTLVWGTGARPNVSLAQAAGLAVEDGVLVDGELITSHPDVYAAGDIASHAHPVFGGRVRVEHWANALEQGLAAGANAAGAATPYTRLPFFFSDQYELGMEYSGWPVRPEEVVIRGSLEAGEFVAFYLKSGVVAGGANVNVWDVNDHVQDLMRAAKPVDAAVLADPGIDPADWVRLAIR